eukprot:14674543-Ditylum_brightwellii.AAC.1
MKQVAFKHGFGDLENLQLYTQNGSKDDDEEITRLQHMATRIGCNLGLKNTLDCSPKRHPEIAGEGIEYVWATLNIYLRG